MIMKKSYAGCFFKQHPVAFTTFAFGVALFQASFLNIAFYMHVFERVSLHTARDFFFLLSMPVVIFCVIYAFLNLLLFPSLAKIFSIIFLLVGSVLSYFMLTFNIVIDHDMLVNALATEASEVFALLTPMLGFFVLFLGILPGLLIVLVGIKPALSKVRLLSSRIFNATGALLIVAIIACVFFKDYAAFFRNNMLTRYLLPSNYIGALQKHYQYIRESRMPFVIIGKDAKMDPVYQQARKKTLAIVVVGETARAMNFSLNGYSKHTNPQLDKIPNVINFPHTTSCGTFTAYSVPCMFSDMTREQYDATVAEHQTNVLDILKLAGVSVLWQENDGGCKGVCVRVPNTDLTVKYRNNSPLCKKGNCYDDILFTHLDNYIENLGDQSAIIALHTIGSHGPAYYQRYPDEFAKFKPSCDTNEINRCDKDALINTYDNTILYTDHFLAKAIAVLKKYQDKYNVILIYMSDHGESLGEKGIYLHSMPYAFAPKEQTHIPFILWASDAFFKDNHINKHCLQTKALNSNFSHDNLFHTLLGVFHIQTNEYDPGLDIFSRCVWPGA